MSLASKLTLAASTVGSVGVIFFVHKNQIDDRHSLREGVLREQERQVQKKQNQRELLEQQTLRAQLEQQEKLLAPQLEQQPLKNQEEQQLDQQGET